MRSCFKDIVSISRAGGGTATDALAVLGRGMQASQAHFKVAANNGEGQLRQCVGCVRRSASVSFMPAGDRVTGAHTPISNWQIA